MNSFQSADILIPHEADLETWAVIACDQFSAQPDYWQRVERRVGERPSALHLILPEAELNEAGEGRIARIHAAMEQALEGDFLRRFPASFVYVERSLPSGGVRRGVVGMLDLEDYDYAPDSAAPVRATEKTVVERIPPRKRIRRGAALELPHVLLLCDDERFELIEPLSTRTGALPALYDFELMEGGGAIRGWLLSGAEAQGLTERIGDYEERLRRRAAEAGRAPLLYAVGDGNHSLATAKACWEDLKQSLSADQARRHPARFALVELENLRDEAQQFTPIHRLVMGCAPEKLLEDAERSLGGEGGAAIPWVLGERRGRLRLAAGEELPIARLQSFLDRWLAENPGELEYIHEDEALIALARRPGSLGFLLPVIEKSGLFPGIASGGPLPRKTFFMGHATEKRYYLEAREIR